MKITCVKVVPGERAVVEERENCLYDWQRGVGGFIEIAYHSDAKSVGKNILVICNEEGKILEMQPNRYIGFDLIFGTFFLIGEDEDQEDFRSLTDNEIAWCMRHYGKPIMFEK